MRRHQMWRHQMWRPTRARTVSTSVGLAVLLGASGCAGASGSGGSGSGGSTSPATGDTTTSGRQDPVAGDFPLSISRTGGIAGFLDLVTVAADGTVTLRSRARSTVPSSDGSHCTLTAQALDDVTAAADAVDWRSLRPPTTSPRMADQLFQQVSSPAGGPASLGDPGLGTLGTLAAQLLADVTGREPAYRLCRPS